MCMSRTVHPGSLCFLGAYAPGVDLRRQSLLPARSPLSHITLIWLIRTLTNRGSELMTSVIDTLFNSRRSMLSNQSPLLLPAATPAQRSLAPLVPLSSTHSWSHVAMATSPLWSP